jgi:hypothetical protein
MTPRLRGIDIAIHLAACAGLMFASGCLQRKLKPLNPCLVSGVVATVAVTNIDKVDMLFMVDNSDSMGDKQTLLRAQFPHLISVMTTGMRDSDPAHNFPAAKDLHIGVVTSDMGLPGVDGITGCTGLGLDGILQHNPSTAIQGCQASYPPFLTFMAGVNQPDQTAKDFQCIASVGTGGCGYEHQLEAPLKALWPSMDKRITFLADPISGKGMFGHGDVENAGFVRNDPVQGLSLIAIILLTDEDDCSSADTRPFSPPSYLDPNDPLAKVSLNLKGHPYAADALYPIDRYVNGYKGLRPGNENLVVFAAITGVPPDLVDPATVLPKIDFTDATQRNGFYSRILADQRMKETINDNGTPGDPTDDRLVHSCVLDPTKSGAANMGQIGAADPPGRIVQVASKFGENAIVQSICTTDYAPALDVIIAIIAKQLGAVCLPRSLVRTSSGTVSCNVVWELPPPGKAPASTPTSCGGNLPFLLQPGPDETQMTDMQGQICKVAQLAVVPNTIPATMINTQGLGPVPSATGGQMFSEGWYYDDFSDEVKKNCTGMSKQRISFTSMAKPPTGVTVKLQCLNERQSLSNTRTDIQPGIEQPTVGSACDHAVINGVTLSGDAACAITLKSQKTDTQMFCHPLLNVCVLACNSDADCPASWVCDTRPETLKATSTRPGHANGNPFCVNPTCGDVK